MNKMIWKKLFWDVVEAISLMTLGFVLGILVCSSLIITADPTPLKDTFRATESIMVTHEENSHPNSFHVLLHDEKENIIGFLYFNTSGDLERWIVTKDGEWVDSNDRKDN